MFATLASEAAKEVLHKTQSWSLYAVRNVALKLKDEVYNCSMNVCHWGVHLMQLNDTAKEADISRVIVKLKYCLPFFFSHN